LRKSTEVADNVVFLCLISAFFMKARLRILDNTGFGLAEILRWPRTGFELGTVHAKRGYRGKTILSRIYF